MQFELCFKLFYSLLLLFTVCLFLCLFPLFSFCFLFCFCEIRKCCAEAPRATLYGFFFSFFIVQFGGRGRDGGGARSGCAIPASWYSWVDKTSMHLILSQWAVTTRHLYTLYGGKGEYWVAWESRAECIYSPNTEIELQIDTQRGRQRGEWDRRGDKKERLWGRWIYYIYIDTSTIWLWVR